MVRKNKLHKHHKTKSYLYFKDFAFGIIGLVTIGAAISIPTYIASNIPEEVSIKADTHKSQIESDKEDNEQLNEEEETLSY